MWLLNLATVVLYSPIFLSAGAALTGGGNFTTDQSSNETITINHEDTSAQASVNNSGRTYIQDVTLDAYGHVTGLVSATETVTNTNTTDWRVQNSSGTQQFQVTASEGVRFAGSGATSVAFDASTQKITISSTDTDTNTTYTAGANLQLSGTSFAVAGSPTFTDVYANGWLRNNDSGEGIYNQATTQHFYSDDDDWWNVGGGTSGNGIRFRDEHAGIVRGAVFADNSSRVGFLDADHHWAVRHTNSGSTTFYSNNSWRAEITSGGDFHIYDDIYIGDAIVLSQNPAQQVA